MAKKWVSLTHNPKVATQVGDKPEDVVDRQVNADATITLNGEVLERERFAYGAGVPSEGLREHWASHPRYRRLTGQGAA